MSLSGNGAWLKARALRPFLAIVTAKPTGVGRRTHSHEGAPPLLVSLAFSEKAWHDAALVWPNPLLYPLEDSAMKIVSSAQLCTYPVGTIFRAIYPPKHRKGYMEPQSFGEYQVIVDKGESGGIWITGDLFDWEDSGLAATPDLKLGDEYPITNDNHTSCAGCFGTHDDGIYQVFNKEDLRRALTRLLIPDWPLTFEGSYSREPEIGEVIRMKRLPQ
jgi:hypothetical protein